MGENIIRPLTDYERGWLEALIDGEGSLGMHKLRTSKAKRGFCWVCNLEIVSTCLELLEIAQKFVGAGRIDVKKEPRNSRWKPSYHLVICPNDMRALLPRLQLVAKEGQRQLLIEALDLVADHRFFASKSKNDARLEEIYQELHLLNRKGPRAKD